MKTIPVKLFAGRGYFLKIGVSLKALGRHLRPLGLSRSMLVVSDRSVARRHAAPLLSGLKRAGFVPRLALLPPGEAHKNLDTVRKLYREGLKARLDRHSAVVALGGGVTGDTAGFMAATYLRGVSLVQCPTTLLAMVDASIGGKTGVDLPEGKNLVGAFHQPRVVWMDLDTLKTLPEREWRTGVAEALKYGLMGEERLIDIFEKHTLADLRGRPKLLEEVVALSAAAKARVVSEDEKETRGRRALLNLGHTFGHAVETVTGYRAYTHGEAISVGMCAAMRLGVKLKRLPFAYVRRLESLLDKWGLPCRARKPLPRAKVLAAMSRDKKVLSGRFRFIVPTGWGRVQVAQDVPAAVLGKVLSEVGL